MSSLRKRLVVGLAVCGIAAALIAEPASARQINNPASLASKGSHSIKLNPLAKSHYLAGYQATDPDHVSAVIIKAVDVPNVTCNKPRFEGVALGGGSEPTVGDVEYFAGIFATCVSGQPQYLMESILGNGDEQGTGIEPGDQAQIVITVQCNAYPTCDVFASATSLDTSTSVSVEDTIDLSTDSAVFGAFPLFDGNSLRPAPVPDFGRVRVQGCLFGNTLLHDGDAQRLTRVRQGNAQIKASKIDVGSFVVRNVG